MQSQHHPIVRQGVDAHPEVRRRDAEACEVTRSLNRAMPCSTRVPMAIMTATPNSPYKPPAALPTRRRIGVAWAAMASSS
ncbi:MAG: hypothetical protein CM15mP128_3370 [Methanobacteriota archaeon]|nr:MAG: hypothetical protein CM15mP128_3370 [Euryarchaeota archaeon]